MRKRQHFWLNEGFTVYAERRIIEVLYGADVFALHAALGRRVLDDSLARFADRPALTRLRTQLWDVDPDDAYSQVPYQKGYFFLATLERAVGRDAFDAWLRTYLAAFRFQAITTDDFIAHFERAFPGTLAARWRTRIDGEGCPTSRSRTRPSRGDRSARASPPPADVAWTRRSDALPRVLPRPAARALCEILDARLTESTNSGPRAGLDSRCARTTRPDSARRGAPRCDGRMKFLRPLYGALPREVARPLFERLRATYHPIARQLVESMLR